MKLACDLQDCPTNAKTDNALQKQHVKSDQNEQGKGNGKDTGAKNSPLTSNICFLSFLALPNFPWRPCTAPLLDRIWNIAQLFGAHSPRETKTN